MAPGSPVTLFWSTRGEDNAVIYQLDRTGNRTRVWNVEPDGNLTVATRASDRGQLDFLLSVGEAAFKTEQGLSIPLACPVQWFFEPSPDDCPQTEPEETFIVEQQMERGRLVYIASRDRVYALFNDGTSPAWISFPNLYDPTIHPESLENFVPPAGFFQPVARLGFVWRGNDTVRNRLGLGISAGFGFDGFIQTATLNDGRESLFISSSDGTALQLLPGGEVWQIITP